MVKLEQLAVTQIGFRNQLQIDKMIAVVASGGVFDRERLEKFNSKDVRPINLIQFEDNRLYIHDGHHRVASIYLGGRKFLYESEFTITQWTYAEYLDINFATKWITPFDPRTEVRVNDYTDFKKYVFYLAEVFGEEEAEKYICSSPDYKQSRRTLTIQDMLRELEST